MNPDRLRQVEDILFQVLELPPEQRTTRLTQLCGQDEELTREVTSLLAQADTSGTFLETPALGTSLADLEPAFGRDESEDLTGQAIGPYRIERKIASGGMGSVYAALRADGQYTQRVAIKIVKRGMDSDEILRRFRVEKQALAALSHPNIAHLVDGGVTTDGRPYLVMEFVDGTSIDEYCDAHSLSIHDRIVILRQVCEAVRFAHQHLIVHRDLKPRNILVTSDGHPKLLDFGIAKVLSPGETVLFGQTTRREEQRLTPEYASPEQMRGERAGTGSDVYSLGVILYEILSGRRPYATPGAMGDGLGKLLREQAPPLPSTAVLKSELVPAPPGATPPTADQLASLRGGGKDRISRQLRGDLDTIVLEAMHADPARRYQSVEALIADIDRYLGGLPISARKDSLWYRSRKFGKRHAFGLSVAALIAVLLVGSLVAVTRERNRAIEALDVAEAVSGFLKRTLESADPQGVGRGRPDAKIGDILDGSTQRARQEFKSRPRILAAVLGALGRSYMALGEYPVAEELLNESLDLRLKTSGTDSTELAESKFNLAELYSNTGRDDLAAPMAREAKELYQQGHASDRLVAMALNNMGSIERRKRNYDEAVRLHREALAIRERLANAPGATLDAQFDLADSYNNLASALRGKKLETDPAKGRSDTPEASDSEWNEIKTYYEKARDVREQALTPDAPLVMQSQFNLAVVYLDAGDTRKAIDLYSATLDTARKSFPGHVETGKSIRNFAKILQRTQSDEERQAIKQGDLATSNALKRERMARSATLLEEAVGILAPKCDESDPTLYTARRWLAYAYRECDRPDEARVQGEIAAANTRESDRTGDDWKLLVEDLVWACEKLHDNEGLERWQKILDQLPQPGKQAK